MGIRKYKMDLPVNTINRIRDAFGKLGLMTYEQYWKNVNDSIYSCGVTLENCQVLRTLGKGMTKELCLASGYGELMERIQNLILFTGNMGLPFTKVLEAWPDVIEIRSMQELLKLNEVSAHESVKKVCEELYIDREEAFCNTVLAGKFYSVKERKTVYLPYSEMYRGVRSNGMCAGNEPAEAIVEGLCEIMERMAIKSIFEGSVVPPIIPADYLKQYEAYRFIEELEMLGIKVEIRDCSLGKGLPVLGMLTINQKTGKYKYNFGAHPDFEQAMKRCMGEICQVSGGVDSIQELIAGGMELSFKEKEEDCSEFKRLSNFYKALKNSNGELPTSFFISEPTYNYEEWSAFRENSCFEEDVRVMCKLIEQDGQEVFIRDVSFLDFPAYQIYVTGYSVVQVDAYFRDSIEYIRSRHTKRNEVRLLSKVRKCSIEEKNDLINFLLLQMNSPKFFNQEEDNNWMREVMGAPVTNAKIQCPQYVLALLELSLKNYEKAYEYYMYAYRKNYLRGTEEEYHNVLKMYLEMMKDKVPEESVQMILERYYNSTVVNKVLVDIDTERIFDRVDLLQFINQREMSAVGMVYDRILPMVKKSCIDMDGLGIIFDEAGE